MKKLYRDYLTVAASAGLRVPKGADGAALTAQMTVVLATFAWNGEL